DGDGDLDLYLINGAPTPGSPPRTAAPRNALFENRDGRFVDVTEASGTGDTGYGMGLCAGDYDADGHLDFLVTNYGPDRLYRNLAGEGAPGRFEQVAESAGVAGGRWGTNCAFADLDGDGDLDLYVTNYVEFDYADNPRCGDEARDVWAYCRPAIFEGQGDFLYINRGDGTFLEEGQPRGIDPGFEERGFGVLASDLDRDGDLDLLVANDGTANRFYRNDGAGRFEDQALESGLALNRNGRPESGMGMALGDVDADGLEDLLVTNYSFETNTLYRNLGGLFFEDATEASGLGGGGSYLPVGWGTALFDLDNDRDLDLAVANGHVMDTIDLFEDGIGYPQSNLLFVNDGRGSFANATALAGRSFTRAGVSRALAVGDFNDDGRLDLLITHTNDRVALLENRRAGENRWLGLRLDGGARYPSAIGARASATCGGESLGEREVRSGGSLLAQDDLRLHFGLGACAGPVEVEVTWPGGETTRKTVRETGRYVSLAPG
ncbi:MAG: CRTAC1 family protein, partial [Acidobacteriota bacterium]